MKAGSSGPGYVQLWTGLSQGFGSDYCRKQFLLCRTVFTSAAVSWCWFWLNLTESWSFTLNIFSQTGSLWHMCTCPQAHYQWQTGWMWRLVKQGENMESSRKREAWGQKIWVMLIFTKCCVTAEALSSQQPLLQLSESSWAVPHRKCVWPKIKKEFPKKWNPPSE